MIDYCLASPTVPVAISNGTRKTSGHQSTSPWLPSLKVYCVALHVVVHYYADLYCHLHNVFLFQ